MRPIKRNSGKDIDVAVERLLFMTTVMLRRTVGVAVDVDVVWDVSVRVPCNGAVQRVPEGIVSNVGLVSEGVQVTWSCISTV